LTDRYHWTRAEIGGHDEPLYDVAALADGCKCIDLGHGAVLLLRESDGLSPFAAFEKEQEDGAGRVRHRMLFHGEGTLAPLRECRHIWFGPDPDVPGYVFYAPLRSMEAAFKALQEFFE
jgi:hypothetical protein